MKTLKELVKAIYERTDAYKLETITAEWEEQNILIDEQQSEISKLTKKCIKLKQDLENEKALKEECISAGNDAISFRVEEIKKLEELNMKLNTKLKEKESARRKLASKIGGYQAKINKLEMQVEFLKTNRRSPNIEEIKDYEYKRKRSVTNE